MVCGTANWTTTTTETVFLYLATDSDTDYIMGDPGFEGHGQLCTLDSENVASGLKECYFTCDCTELPCSNIFLTLTSKNTSLCEIFNIP